MRVHLYNFGQAIEQFRVDNETLPSGLEDLAHPARQGPFAYLDQVPRDPWGREYLYKVLGETRYEIRSLGEDPDDPADDIVYPEPE